MLIVDSQIQIPVAEFQFAFARSAGPGGQNVNKVNSKATLRWPVARSPSLPEPVRLRFLARFAKRLTAEGELLISSQRYREQSRNIADCLEKLREMVLAAAVKPTLRRPTKPTASSRRRRTETKRKTSQKKQARRPPEAE